MHDFTKPYHVTYHTMQIIIMSKHKSVLSTKPNHNQILILIQSISATPQITSHGSLIIPPKTHSPNNIFPLNLTLTIHTLPCYINHPTSHTKAQRKFIRIYAKTSLKSPHQSSIEMSTWSFSLKFPSLGAKTHTLTIIYKKEGEKQARSVQRRIKVISSMRKRL